MTQTEPPWKRWGIERNSSLQPRSLIVTRPSEVTVSSEGSSALGPVPFLNWLLCALYGNAIIRAPRPTFKPAARKTPPPDHLRVDAGRKAAVIKHPDSAIRIRAKPLPASRSVFGRVHDLPRTACVRVEFNGDPRNADQIWMIGAAVCLRVAGHDVIRPRPSEVPRASVALRAAATPARATLSRPAGRTRGTGHGRMVHQARRNSGS
jgi:hypothetical protein